MANLQENAAHSRTLSANKRRWLELSGERDSWGRLAINSGRDGYRAGYADGWHAGYAASCADLDRAWNTAAAPFRNSQRPDQAEIEGRRWGPGGRKHFGDPRPGDFTGTGE